MIASIGDDWYRLSSQLLDLSLVIFDLPLFLFDLFDIIGNFALQTYYSLLLLQQFPFNLVQFMLKFLNLNLLSAKFYIGPLIFGDELPHLIVDITSIRHLGACGILHCFLL